ncbi:hypothetical protein [Bacillus horti]|uniref:Uncharacterized protein n=1 Tax=Caldalkalibacillus horti TaxID=77523 RepID=A0ABT9W4F3_9BACI|nr:hypothetical protein [Bacillus horti]MDQ0168126.1 hypothetical protein [Bacillus horti]
MEFVVDFVLIGLLIIAFTAFSGIISTTIASWFGGKKKDDAYDFTVRTKDNWKPVERKRS